LSSFDTSFASRLTTFDWITVREYAYLGGVARGEWGMGNECLKKDKSRAIADPAFVLLMILSSCRFFKMSRESAKKVWA